MKCYFFGGCADGQQREVPFPLCDEIKLAEPPDYETRQPVLDSQGEVIGVSYGYRWYTYRLRTVVRSGRTMFIYATDDADHNRIVERLDRGYNLV